MAEITIAQITELRALTNAGMMDCKKALAETAGNMDEAIKVLRLKGQAIQIKRADKEAKEGLIACAASCCGNAIALVEVNCETDFVAKTDNFKKFVNEVAEHVLAKENIEETLKETHASIVASTGENVKIRRSDRFELQGTGKVESYIHLGGKVGVLVEVACEKAETAAAPEFAALVHDIALQVAAAAPRYLDETSVSEADLESEKNLYRQQIAAEGKPENLIEKILVGKVKKFYADVCLINQAFVKEPKMSITQLIDGVAKQLNDKIVIKRYARFQLGAA